MDWIFEVGKLFFNGLILFLSWDLLTGTLRLRRKYGLSFGVEDWVEWKDWFIFYLPLQIARARFYTIFWCVGFASGVGHSWFL